MSISSILQNPNNPTEEPETWTNLNVNSLRAKQINLAVGAPSGSSNVYLNTTSGLDSNTGLTSDSPVLTLSKALQVAMSSRINSATEIVINLAGAATLNLGLAASELPNAAYELNLSNLGAKFSFIKFKGSLVNTTAVPAANASVSYEAGAARFTRYTYSGGLVNADDYTATGSVAYVANKDIVSYSAIISGNTGADHVVLTRPDDGLQSFAWTVGLIDCPELISSSSLAIVSKVPVIFEFCKLESGTVASHKWLNFTGQPIVFLGSRARTRTAGWLDYGEWCFYGSTLTQEAGAANHLNTDKGELCLNYCLIYARIIAESEFNANYCDINGPGRLEFLAAPGNLDNCSINIGISTNAPCLHLSGSTVRANDVDFTSVNSDVESAIYCEDSTLSLKNTHILRSAAATVNSHAINAFGSIISIEGSDIQLTTGGSVDDACVKLENSQLYVRGDDGGVRVLSSTADVVVADNSHVYIDGIVGAASDLWTSSATAANIVYGLNSKVNLPEVPFAFNNNVNPAFRAVGLTDLCFKEGAGWVNTGTGSLYSLAGSAAVSDTTIAPGFVESTTAGNCRLFVGNL